jgi:hypothetical protein
MFVHSLYTLHCILVDQNWKVSNSHYIVEACMTIVGLHGYVVSVWQFYTASL